MLTGGDWTKTTFVDDLARRVTQGDIRALARVCRFIDDQRAGYRELLRDLYPHGKAAWIVGVTGSPGAGKSTLTDALVGHFRERDWRVAVVAIDPSSPFSGGAFLGDRIRLQRHFEDPQVFIRSLATRGALGGLSRSTQDTIVAAAAWQAHVVIVETVGVGQDELDITRAADTTCVVVAPGMGDDIQATKAGILEAADVFVVNKADRDGADAAVRDLEAMLALAAPVSKPSAIHAGHHARWFAPPSEVATGWTPPIVRAVATRGDGVAELVNQLERHRAHLTTTGKGVTRRRARAELLLMTTVQSELVKELTDRLSSNVSDLVDRIERSELDPYTAADALLQRMGASLPPA